MLWFSTGKKTITVRKTEATSQERPAGCNKPVLMNLFDNLGVLMTKHKFQAHEIWNGDETKDQVSSHPLFKKSIGSTDWIIENPGGIIIIKEIEQVSRSTFHSSFTPQKIIALGV